MSNSRWSCNSHYFYLYAPKIILHLLYLIQNLYLALFSFCSFFSAFFFVTGPSVVLTVISSEMLTPIYLHVSSLSQFLLVLTSELLELSFYLTFPRLHESVFFLFSPQFSWHAMVHFFCNHVHYEIVELFFTRLYNIAPRRCNIYQDKLHSIYSTVKSQLNATLTFRSGPRIQKRMKVVVR